MLLRRPVGCPVPLDLVTRLSARNIWIRQTTCSWPLARVFSPYSNLWFHVRGQYLRSRSLPPSFIRSPLPGIEASKPETERQRGGGSREPPVEGDGKSKSPTARVDCDLHISLETAQMI